MKFRVWLAMFPVRLLVTTRIVLPWLESQELPEMLIESIFWHFPVMRLLTITQIRWIIKYVRSGVRSYGTQVDIINNFCREFDYRGFPYLSFPKEFIGWLNDNFALEVEKKIIAGSATADDLYDALCEDAQDDEFDDDDDDEFDHFDEYDEYTDDEYVSDYIEDDFYYEDPLANQFDAGLGRFQELDLDDEPDN
jgi:hypothetical protein